MRIDKQTYAISDDAKSSGDFLALEITPLLVRYYFRDGAICRAEKVSGWTFYSFKACVIFIAFEA